MKVPQKPNSKYLDLFINEFWFAPSDILLRSIEANVMSTCKLIHPVLDIGIGDGGVDKYIFYKKGIIDMGIDPDASGFEKAKETGIYKKIQNDSAEKMSFKNSSFNTIVSNSTFEHITHDTKAVAEVSRVLKKGGKFYITVPSEFLPIWVLEFEKNENPKTAGKKLTAFNNRLQHYHYRSANDWVKLFEKNNVKVVSYDYYFSKQTTKVWYRLFKFVTRKVKKREVWSLLAHSHFTPLIPVAFVKTAIRKIILRKPFENGYFCREDEVGSMLFMVAEKM